MTDKDIKRRRASVQELINSGRIHDAIAILECALTDPHSKTGLNRLKDTYKYMLSFFMQSTSEASDPGREAMYADIVAQLHKLNDQAEIEALRSASSHEYFAKMRLFALHPELSVTVRLQAVWQLALNVQLADEAAPYSEQLHKELESKADDLFNHLRTTVALSSEETDAILSVFEDEDAGEAGNLVQSLMVAALFLGCMEYYDRAKLIVLLRAVLGTNDTRIIARALTVSLLLIYFYSRHVKADKEVISLIARIQEMDGFDAVLRSFVSAMMRTIDTDRINKKMTEELMPELIKLKPEIEKHLRGLGDQADISDMEGNPEWQDMLESSGLAEKMRSFGELQIEGGDIFMSAFSQMKNYPFFRISSNWFLPFYASYSALNRLPQAIVSNLVKTMANGTQLCASDKYSMALAMGSIPQAQLQMLLGQLGAQLDALEEERKATFSETTKLPLEAEMSMYLKDIFRFFRLSPIKDELPPLFDRNFTLPECIPFDSLRNNTEFLTAMAEFYFKYGYYADASALYGYLQELPVENAEEIYEKLGYCYEKLGNYAMAEAAYRKAELLNSDNHWLMLHIGKVLRLQGEIAKAIIYYEKANERKPDKKSTQLALARLYIEAGRTKDALKIYYKWAYIAEHPDVKIERAIAWCEFLEGNFAKSAEKYKALGEHRTPTDMLNHGHAVLAQHEIAEAVSIYREFIRTSGKSADEIRQLISTDAPELIKAGVVPIELSLLLDGLL